MTILNTVIFIDTALIFHKENFENVMFYDFIYLAKGFRMRPKVRTILNPKTGLHKSSPDFINHLAFLQARNDVSQTGSPETLSSNITPL